MKELQRKQRLKRLVYSLPSIALLAMLTFFLVKGAISVLNVERESAQRVAELKTSSATLVSREQKLRSDITRLQTEEGIMEEIKEKFSVTRSGEHVAIIVDEEIKPAPKATSTADRLKTWWQGFLSLWSSSSTGYNAPQ